MVLGPAELDSLDLLCRREWLETDGLGSCASGTLAGVATRRRHGWLSATGRDGTPRVLLAKLEEAAFVDGQRYELGASQYPDVVHPEGFRYIAGFRLDPWPIWTYHVGEAVLERHLALLHGTQTLVIVYRLVAAPGAVSLELRPLVAGRPADETRGENSQFDRGVRSRGEQFEVAPYGPGSRLVLTWTRGLFLSDGMWYYQFQYRADAAREDLFSPGLLLYTLHEGEQAVIAASTSPLDGLDLEIALNLERDRRIRLQSRCPHAELSLAAQLVLTADQWICHRGKHNSVGTPWACDQPPADEDVFRFLPGLARVAGRPELARELLLVQPPGPWLAWTARQLGLADEVSGLVADWVAAVRGGFDPTLREEAGWLVSAAADPIEANLLWRASLLVAGQDTAATDDELRARWTAGGSPWALVEPDLLDTDTIGAALDTRQGETDPWANAALCLAARRLGRDWPAPDAAALRGEGVLGHYQAGGLADLAGLLLWLDASRAQPA